MESRENPVFGRKVFFLNPTFAMESVLIEKLIEDEFETYIIHDYHDAKNVLRSFPDSICFINIDDQLNHEQWFNFIQSFETDESLKSIFFGVLSTRINKSNRDLFMLKLSIPAGFIMMNERMEDTITTIEGILNINGAKGRRQYVRTSCLKDPDAVMLVQQNNKMYKLHLIDISVVGTAAVIPLNAKDMFPPNTVMRNISITLGTKNIAVNAAVYAVIPTDKYCKLILLFMQVVPFATKKIIRGYISETLQREVADIIKVSTKDNTDYTKPVKADAQTAQGAESEPEDAFLVSADEDDPAANSTVNPQNGSTPDDLSITHLF